MNNKYTNILVLIIIVLSSQVSHAQEFRDNYFFLTMGQSSIQDKSVDFDEQGLTANFGYGYRFSDFFALELSGVYYGETKKSNATVVFLPNEEFRGDLILEGYAFMLQGVGILPVTRTIDLYAKAGVASWKFTSNAEGDYFVDGAIVGPVDDKETSKGNDLLYGVGIRFAVDHDSSIRFDLETYYDLEVDNEKTDIITITLGFQHNF